MMYWNGGMGAGAWLFMLLNTLALWGFLIGVVWLVVRTVRGNLSHLDHTRPERLLAERFAKGDIDEQEYRQRLETLQRSAK